MEIYHTSCRNSMWMSDMLTWNKVECDILDNLRLQNASKRDYKMLVSFNVNLDDLRGHWEK